MQCRTMFSPSEEEVISRFLISCWKKKLQVPHILLYDALKKHVDKFPRKTRAKDNRPSHFWKQRFFQRNPHVQEAFDTFKSSPYKDYDVVSDHMLNTFISDLAGAEKPYLDEDISIASKEGTSSSSGKSRKKLTGKISPLKARKLQDTPQKERMKKLADNLIKHRRSKTASLSLVGAGSSQAKEGKPSPVGKVGRRKSIGGLKLSSALFSSKKTDDSANESVPAPDKQTKKVLSIPSLSGVVVQPKSLSQPTKRNEVSANAVPLEAIKFEVGANVEAMDGYKWYKAKIVEVYHQKQQVLIHFNGWRKKFDTVFPMNSKFLRGPTEPDKKAGMKRFNVGDDVLSQWSDGKFYPGTVISVKETGSYVVMFYDGLKKLVRPNMLKPLTSEKEKDAAMKEAQKTYLLPYDQSATSSPYLSTSGAHQLTRRYRTSANDRERRVTARQTSGGDGNESKQVRAARKRKRAHTIDPPVPSSPSSGHMFQAKQARLDKITDTLLDKAVPTSTVTPTALTFTSSLPEMTSSRPGVMPTLPETSAKSSVALPSSVHVQFHQGSYLSDDESDNPLIIDEGETLADVESKPFSVSKEPVSTPATFAASASDLSKSVNETLLKSDDDTVPPSSALAGQSKTKKKSQNRSQIKETMEPSPQLASDITSATTENPEENVGKELSPDEEKSLPFEKKIELALKKILKQDIAVTEVAEELDLKVEEVHDAVAQHPGVILGDIDTRFLVTSEEDSIVNWIHDVTDLGWGVKPGHIAKRIKFFLTSESYQVLFDDSNPLNVPTVSWINDFLARHPEIFPGREKPMGRFRFDREGFEDWLGRWLAVLRSKNVKTNAVFYCDETVWDLNAKLPELTLLHQTRTLDSTHKNGNRITTISCIGATGVALTPFYVFPDNEKSAKIEKNLYTDQLVFSTRGALNSNIFLYWMKKIFIPGIPAKKRPAVLLVDAQLEILDYEIIKFAEENDIILYRFLPQGAHFIQHPDQQLFGRLRLQWKKAVFNNFLKENTGKTITTNKLLSHYSQEFHRIASSSTIKMCFVLTKLYEPLPEPMEDSPKEKKKRRKSSAAKARVASTDEKPAQTEKEKPEPRRLRKTDDDVKKSAAETSKSKSSASVVQSPTSESPKTKLSDLPKPKTGGNRGRGSSRFGRGRGVALGRGRGLSLGRGRGHGFGRGRGFRRGRGLGRGGIGSRMKVPAVAPHPHATPVMKSKYKKGETVLAKWTDCKLYSATVLKKIGKDNYKIEYFDGLVKVVTSDFLRAWSIESTPTPASASTSSGQSPAPTSKSPTSTAADDQKSQNLRRGILPTSSKREKISSESKIRTRNSLGKIGMGRGRRRKHDGAESLPDLTFSSVKPEDRIRYKSGDSVSCKWTDRKMYPATIVKQVSDERYMVKYFDNRKKVVHFSWLWPAKLRGSTAAQSQTVQPQEKTAESKRKRTSSIKSQAKDPPVESTPSSELATSAEESSIPLPTPLTVPDDADLPTTKPPSPPQQATSPSATTPHDNVKSEIISNKSTTAIPAISSSKASEKPTLSFRTRRSLSKQDSTESSASSKVSSISSTKVPSTASTKVPSTASTKVPSTAKQTEQKVPSTSGESNGKEDDFVKGDSVLARWSDCRSYPASVLKQTEEGMYKVRYYDGMVRTLKKDMLKKWDINSTPLYKPRRRLKKQDKIDDIPKAAAEISSGTKQAVKSKEKPAPPKDVKPAVTNEASEVKPAPVVKPVSLTYEAYYAKLTQESELHKFKCRAPGCNKVFRRESVLKQHHKHYHLQRYKLRDQEVVPAVKRKASKEELPPAKRRTSSDINLTFPKPKSPPPVPVPQTTSERTVSERPSRSKGGKPPLDVIQQNTEKLTTSRESSTLKKVTSPEKSKSGELPEKEKPVTPTKKRRKKSDSPQIKGQASSSVNTPSEEPKSGAVVNEDVIRCVCEKEEDVGFMLQCDSCLTWQHASCEGIASPRQDVKEDNLPEYMCTICKDPPGVRESHRYRYDNNFLTKGILPTASTQSDMSKKEMEQEKHFEKLMLATNRLMEELAKMQESLHGIRMKINIADPGYTHPLLHLWKDAGSIQTLIKQSKSGDLTTGQFQIQGERLHASTSVKIEVKSPRREEQMNISADETAATTDDASSAARYALESIMLAIECSTSSEPINSNSHPNTSENEEGLKSSSEIPTASDSVSNVISELVDKVVVYEAELHRGENVSNLSGDPNGIYRDNSTMDVAKVLSESNVENFPTDPSNSLGTVFPRMEKSHVIQQEPSCSESITTTVSPSSQTEKSQKCEKPTTSDSNKFVSETSTAASQLSALASTSKLSVPADSLSSSGEKLGNNIVQTYSEATSNPVDSSIDEVGQGGSASIIRRSLSQQESASSTPPGNPQTQDSGYHDSTVDLQPSVSSGFYEASSSGSANGGMESVGVAESSASVMAPESQTSDPVPEEQESSAIPLNSSSKEDSFPDQEESIEQTPQQKERMEVDSLDESKEAHATHTALVAPSEETSSSEKQIDQNKTAFETSDETAASSEKQIRLDSQNKLAAETYDETPASFVNQVGLSASDAPSDSNTTQTLTQNSSEQGSEGDVDRSIVSKQGEKTKYSDENMEGQTGGGSQAHILTGGSNEHATTPLHPDTANVGGKDDLWTSIPIIKERRPLVGDAIHRSRSKSEDTREEETLRSRGNLLQHIHRLELALSERLTRIENYVTTVESAFNQLVCSSPTSSGSMTSTYDNRLGELQSDLDILHKDVESVEKLFLA